MDRGECQKINDFFFHDTTCLVLVVRTYTHRYTFDMVVPTLNYTNQYTDTAGGYIYIYIEATLYYFEYVSL